MVGNGVDMDRMPLRAGHFRVLGVASLEQVSGAALSTLVGVVLPLMHLSGVALGPMAQGAIGASGLVGIMIGSMLIGVLSDRFGYLLFFRLCPLLVCAAALTAFLCVGVGWTVVMLFVMGVGIGGGYSLDSDYISEIMPRRWKLFMVGVAKASSSLGNVLSALVCLLWLGTRPSPARWPTLWLVIAALSGLTLLLLLRAAQSPGWLASRGRNDAAQRAVERMLGQDVRMGEVRTHAHGGAWRELFAAGDISRVLFSGIPWACEGFGVYGIGVFLPMLMMALGLYSDGMGVVGHLLGSVRMTLWVSCFIIPGFVLGLLLLNRCDHVRMQFWGFVGCTVGLLVLLLFGRGHHATVWSVCGFALYELAINAGPHLVTFILPAQIYPVTDRASGAGLAASFGKLGAVAGVLLVPLMLHRGGMTLVLIVTAAVEVSGAMVTAFLGRRVLPERTHGLPAHSPAHHLYLN